MSVIRVRELRQNVEFLLNLPLSRSHQSICRYGRFSKSIRPDEVGACYHCSSWHRAPSPKSLLMDMRFLCSLLLVCGACKIGTLRPLFTVRTKTPRKTVNSRMAARSPRGAFLIYLSIARSFGGFCSLPPSYV